MSTIDLNADVGEGFDESDRLLLDVITSANVACGFHAGGEETARALCTLAAERGVAIGAHVGYRDRVGFGRHDLGIPAAQVEEEAVEQIALLQEWSGGNVVYVKPHGALYHRASADADCADALSRAAGDLPMLAFPGSELLRRSHIGVPEGFADRGYGPDGLLIARGEPGALLGLDEASEQAVRIAREGVVRSICLHGDSPGAVDAARRIRAALDAAGISVAPFA
jgi:UPF0271 protein